MVRSQVQISVDNFNLFTRKNACKFSRESNGEVIHRILFSDCCKGRKNKNM